eukprot:325048-Prymnesium_polylepis.1
MVPVWCEYVRRVRMSTWDRTLQHLGGVWCDSRRVLKLAEAAISDRAARRTGVLAGQEPLRRAYCCCLCTRCATAASAVCAWARCSCWRRVWVVVRLLAFGTVHVMVLGRSLETLRVAGRCRGPRNGKLPTASARPLYLGP